MFIVFVVFFLDISSDLEGFKNNVEGGGGEINNDGHLQEVKMSLCLGKWRFCFRVFLIVFSFRNKFGAH